MGFYYSSGAPDPEDKPGGLKEALVLTWVVLRVLALPLGIIFGGIFGLLLVLWLFTVNALFGLAIVLLGVGALLARGIWEAKHPPELP